jgi:carboxymethylenebutenolidase
LCPRLGRREYVGDGGPADARRGCNGPAATRELASAWRVDHDPYRIRQRSRLGCLPRAISESTGRRSRARDLRLQLAANGYIAIAPDLLTGKVALQADTVVANVATAAVRSLRADDVHRQLEAVARYGMSLPAALPKYGIVGYCWGGSTSFAHAVRSPAGLGAAVVYYGSSPDASDLARVNVPVLGLYGGNDQRVNATVPRADTVMRRLGKSFDIHFFDGAGHGFLRQQDGQSGANLAASQKAWPLTVAFFRRHLQG